MSCYNPLQLPMYDDDEGGRVYITCTFVNSFSGVVHKQQKCDRLSLARQMGPLGSTIAYSFAS